MKSDSLRAAAVRLMRSMAAVGMDPDIWHMTPSEILLKIETFRRRRAWPEESAWLIGQYAAIGVLTPKRYPHRPRQPARGEVMRDEIMQQVLTRIAERRNHLDP